MDEFNDNSKMPFGKYKDYPLVSVPASYLLFLRDNDKAGRIKDYIETNLEVLQKEVKKGRNLRDR